jgi:hypothetical protein
LRGGAPRLLQRATARTLERPLWVGNRRSRFSLADVRDNQFECPLSELPNVANRPKADVLTFRMTRREAVGVDAVVRGRYSHLAFCRADVTLTSTLAYSDEGLAV